MEAHGEAGSFPPNISAFQILNTVLHKEPIFSIFMHLYIYSCMYYLLVCIHDVSMWMYACLYYVCMYALYACLYVCKYVCVPWHVCAVIGQPFGVDCLLPFDMSSGD